jgi:hypothetical protein
MRLRGVSAAAAAVVVVACVVPAATARAATGTTVTPRVVTGSGLGFDAASAPSTAQVRAWSGSPYHAVNVYFSGSQRLDTTQTQLGNDTTWTATVLSNGWSLIPTVVDLQAPCYAGKKQKMSANASTAAAQGRQVAGTTHNDLVRYGLGGTVAYLDLENFDIPAGNTTCGPAVQAFVRAFTNALHGAGDMAGVYFNAHHGATTIVSMYGRAGAPDDVWVANWNGSATPGDASIGSKWLHHRIHQYYSDGTGGNPLETYGNETINVDRNAIDGDVVTAGAVHIGGYNVSAPGTGLNERPQPNTASTSPNTLADGTSLAITCQASGQPVDGDLVWDKLSDGLYASDLYTTTTGRNGFSSAVPRCDTTPPMLSVAPLPSVTVGPRATIAWSAADSPDPDGNPNGEARGISGTTVRFRTANWRRAFGAWRTYTTTTAGSVRLTLSLGYTYCIQVQTRDLSGNASPWSRSTCTTRPLDDRALAASSGWARKSNAHYYAFTFTKASTKGRVLSFARARARHLAVVAATCTTCGAVRVYIGSHYVGTVSLRASTTRFRQLFDLKPFAITSGTVKLVTTSNRLVRVDGLVIARV